MGTINIWQMGAWELLPVERQERHLSSSPTTKIPTSYQYVKGGNASKSVYNKNYNMTMCSEDINDNTANRSIQFGQWLS
jgi:hypothetical protein